MVVVVVVQFVMGTSTRSVVPDDRVGFLVASRGAGRGLNGGQSSSMEEEEEETGKRDPGDEPTREGGQGRARKRVIRNLSK